MIGRYENQSVRQICCDSARYARWVRVELAALVAQREEAPAALLEQCCPPALQVRRYERENGHEVLAFLQAWDREIVKRHPDGQMAKWAGKIHQRLTSSDVADTAQSLELVAILDLVDEYAGQLQSALLGLAAEDYPQVGRTHGQWAVVRMFGSPWRVHQGVVGRMRGRIEAARASVQLAKFAGPVGTSGLPREVARAAASALGLWLVSSTQIIPRDGLSTWAHVLADLVTECEAIATQVWLLAQSEVGEVREGGVVVGSSAMPHKRNPVRSENIRGLARMARTRAAELQLGLVQFGDHDLAHSSVERVAIPDLAHLTCTALVRTIELLADLQIYPDRMADHVHEAHVAGADSYDTLNEQVDRGVDYLQAHAAGSKRPS